MGVEFVSGLGVFSTPPSQESLLGEAKAEYEKLMKSIRELLNKSSFTKEDGEKLKEAMRGLERLEQEGLLEGKMKDEKKFLFMFFEAAGIDPYSSASIDPKTLESLKKPMTVDGKEVTIRQILDWALDGKGDKTLGDMLLDFARWGYDNYAKQVKDLQDQIQVSIQVIRNIQALQEILNQLKIEYPPNFKLPPESLNDIPEELREIIREKLGGAVDTDQKLENWVKDKNNLKELTNCADKYFRKEYGVTPDLKPDSIFRLLKLRDSLSEELQALIDGGADLNAEGSPANTLKKVLDDLLEKFPDKEPLKIGTDWDDKFLIKDPMTGEPIIPPMYDYDEALGLDKLAEDWVMGGQKGNVNQNLDKALSANQNLSAELSDKLKQKNLELQTMFDILPSTLKAWDKMIQTSAQKVSR